LTHPYNLQHVSGANIAIDFFVKIVASFDFCVLQKRLLGFG